jgi:hypothetical protein
MSLEQRARRIGQRIDHGEVVRARHDKALGRKSGAAPDIGQVSALA